MGGDVIVPKQTREFNGAFLISKEEIAAAAKEDAYLLKILDYIEQDRAYIMQLKHEVSEAMSPIRKLRTRIQMVRQRIEARKRQHKYFALQLRKRMAWEKIKQIRKEANIN